MISQEQRSKLCRIRKQLVDQLATIDEVLDYQKESDNCLNCELMGDNGMCSKWEAFPPDAFLKQGCGGHMPIIPF